MNARVIRFWILVLLSLLLKNQSEIPPGWRVDNSPQYIFVREPGVKLVANNIRIEWITREAIPPARVHLGIVLPDWSYQEPEYRLSVTERSDEKEISNHSVEFPLQRLKFLFKELGLKEDGSVTIYYRIEQWSYNRQKPQYLDSRFQIALINGSYRILPAISEGPFVDMLLEGKGVVSWETESPTRGEVLVKGRFFTRTFGDGELKKRHEIRLSGLKSDREYVYQVRVITADGFSYLTPEYRIRLSGMQGDRFSFVVLSDARAAPGGAWNSSLGINQKVLREIMRAVYQLKPAFVIFGGDLISGYSHDPRFMEEQYQAFKKVVEPVGHSIPIYEVPGNHEMCNYRLVQIEDDSKVLYVDRSDSNSLELLFSREFVNPENGPPPEGKGMPPYGESAYMFYYGNSAFICINTYYNVSTNPDVWPGNRGGNIMLKQLRWIERKLQEARQKGVKHIFVIGHHPGFPNGGHVGDSMYWNNKIKRINQMRERFWGILSKYGVDVYFSGHEHNYSRVLVDSELAGEMKRGVYQIVTGRAGAPFYLQDESVPWSERVEKFDLRNHFVLVQVSKENLEVIAYTVDGEIIDRFSIGK